MRRSLRSRAGDLGRLATYHRTSRIVRAQAAGAAGGAVVGVYRKQNERIVRKLVEPALPAGWTTAWWALDDVAMDLRDYTVGCGSGAKFALLNEVLARIEIGGGWLVVADDDVEFARGSVVELVAACDAAGFALAQPSHVAASEVSHEITLSRAFAIARRTNFVEIGPLFVVGPACRDAVVPFPPHEGMGWGLELAWSELLERGCRLGIVDAVAVKHLGVVGGDYDRDREKALLQARLGERGIEDWREAQATLETWRPWQRRPPWRIAA